MTNATTRPIPKLFFRLLKAFAFDPSASRNYGNFMTLRVRFEDDLAVGPIGRYVAVVDYDAPNRRYYEPVDLEHRLILANNGLDPSESDPRFHQQMVYAVVSETIERFKYALGRDIHWRGRTGRKDSPFHNKLLLLPHGVQEANAYYDPKMHAIVFGYFAAPETDPGMNLPGQTIFTCLAHDIIAHETTHALVDGIRRYYMQPTNPDVAAFHEGFADIVALFQHFSIKEAVLEALRGTAGALVRPRLDAMAKPGKGGPRVSVELTRDNPLVGLANQFGDGIGLHGPLRSAIGTPPDPKALLAATEPHDRGAILVAAVFDAFYTIFVRRTRDLWRIAGISPDNARDVDLRPDLLERLADEASRVAGHFSALCIRALDYCPAVDITFGDYLRALITADHDLVRDDDLGYRSALIDAFRLRGIRPEKVISYSEESLLWIQPESSMVIQGLQMHPPKADEPERRRIDEQNARVLYEFAVKNASDLGVGPENISVESFHYVHRVGPDGNLEPEMVATIIERGRSNGQPDKPLVFGGVTLLFNADGTVRYCIGKSLKHDRGENQAAFQRELWERTPEGLYEDFKNTEIDFRAIHRGY